MISKLIKIIAIWIMPENSIAFLTLINSVSYQPFAFREKAMIITAASTASTRKQITRSLSIQLTFFLIILLSIYQKCNF